MATVQRASWSHRRRLLGGSYADQILALGPVAYWPLDEPAGAVAKCLTNPAMNGAAVGVTWANDTTGPFGTPAPFFDGINDYIDIQTATLEALWNAGGAEWSLLFWWKVTNATVWTDATYRKSFSCVCDASNDCTFSKNSTDNQVQGKWEAGGTSAIWVENGVTATDWQCSIHTRSESADQTKWYLHGVLKETDTGLAAWAAGSPWSRMLIGTSSIGSQPWYGWIAHVALFPFALSQPLVTRLTNP